MAWLSAAQALRAEPFGLLDSLAIVGISIAAFIATNLDNLFLLVGFLAGSKGRTINTGTDTLR